MDAKTMYLVVCKLVGDTTPRGDSYCDTEALNRAKELIELTDMLIGYISSLRQYANSSEGSVRDVGEEARNYLIELENQLPY